MMRRILFAVLAVIVALICVSCGGDRTAGAKLTADSTEINVGEKVVIEVSLSGCPKAKSVGFEINYDSDYFDLVSGEMLVKGELSDFSDGTGVVAFSQAEDINTKMMRITLKAKKATKGEEISCSVSVKDSDNKSVDVKVESVNVTIKN